MPALNFLGSTKVVNYRLGSVGVDQIRLGSVLVWGKEPPLGALPCGFYNLSGSPLEYEIVDNRLDSGEFELSGSEFKFIAPFPLETGQFTATGISVGFNVILPHGEFDLIGPDQNFFVSLLKMNRGQFHFTGRPLNSFINDFRKLDKGAFALTSEPADFVLGVSPSMDTGQFRVFRWPAKFFKGIPLEVGDFNLIMNNGLIGLHAESTKINLTGFGLTGFISGVQIPVMSITLTGKPMNFGFGVELEHGLFDLIGKNVAFIIPLVTPSVPYQNTYGAVVSTSRNLAVPAASLATGDIAIVTVYSNKQILSAPAEMTLISQVIDALANVYTYVYAEYINDIDSYDGVRTFTFPASTSSYGNRLAIRRAKAPDVNGFDDSWQVLADLNTTGTAINQSPGAGTDSDKQLILWLITHAPVANIAVPKIGSMTFSNASAANATPPGVTQLQAWMEKATEGPFDGNLQVSTATSGRFTGVVLAIRPFGA